MSQIEALVKEMDQEAATTRKMLSRIPDDKYDWKPHEKSMTIRRLASHIAELPSWVSITLNTDELDFASSPYVPFQVNNTAELMAYFEKEYAEGRAQLEKATEADLLQEWKLRSGDVIHKTTTKGEMIRSSYSQVVHHRAQMGVYLRLLDIPIPGSYGPSADEMNF